MRQLVNGVANLYTWQTNKQTDEVYTYTNVTVYLVINIRNTYTVNMTDTHTREHTLLTAEMFRHSWTILSANIHEKQNGCYSLVTPFVFVYKILPHTRELLPNNKVSHIKVLQTSTTQIVNTTPECLCNYWKVFSLVNTLIGRFSRVRTSRFSKFAGSPQEHHSGPSMDRSIRTVRQFKQVFEPYRRMLKELNEKKRSSSHHNVSAKKALKILNMRFSFGGGGAVNYSRTFAFHGVSWNLIPTKSEEWLIAMVIIHYGLCHCLVKFPKYQASLKHNKAITNIKPELFPIE
jgi:hypothetical protein